MLFSAMSIEYLVNLFQSHSSLVFIISVVTLADAAATVAVHENGCGKFHVSRQSNKTAKALTYSLKPHLKSQVKQIKEIIENKYNISRRGKRSRKKNSGPKMCKSLNISVILFYFGESSVAHSKMKWNETNENELKSNQTEKLNTSNIKQQMPTNIRSLQPSSEKWKQHFTTQFYFSWKAHTHTVRHVELAVVMRLTSIHSTRI